MIIHFGEKQRRVTESFSRVDTEGLINKVTEEKDLGKGGSKLCSFRGQGVLRSEEHLYGLVGDPLTYLCICSISK